MCDIEIWKDIKGYEGYYQVSNLGRVRSLDRYRTGKRGAKTFCKGIVMVLAKGKNGYLTISLRKERNVKKTLVHRLVGIAFIPNEKNLPCIDHIDGDRGNNRVENLRWCTTKENMNYELVRKNISIVQKSSERCRQHLKEIQESCKRPIVAILPNGEIRLYNSAREAEEKDGFNHSRIAAVCRGREKSHRGCKFYYETDYNVKEISKRSG